MTADEVLTPAQDRPRLSIPDDNPIKVLAKTGACAFGYTSHLSIGGRLAQLLRLRVAQINACVYCLDVHYRAARAAGIPQLHIDLLPAWWDSDCYSDAEKAALAYGEGLTRLSDTTSTRPVQALHDALGPFFAPSAVVEIVGVVINMNIWTRLKVAEGADPAPL